MYLVWVCLNNNIVYVIYLNVCHLGMKHLDVSEHSFRFRYDSVHSHVYISMDIYNIRKFVL